MPIKTLLTILGTTVLIWGLHFVPQLDWIKGPDLTTIGRIVGMERWTKPPETVPSEKAPPVDIVVPETSPAKPPVAIEKEPASHTPDATSVKPPEIATGPPTSLIDITGQMQSFYAALSRTQAKQAGGPERSSSPRRFFTGATGTCRAKSRSRII